MLNAATSKGAERRQFERHMISRPTRFISRTDLETCGHTIDVSEGGMAIAADTSADIGDEIVAYPEGLGRLAGIVVRKFDGGIGVCFTMSEGQRTSFAKRISSAITGMPYLRLFENRSSRRIGMNLPAVAFLADDSGGFDCIIVDMSQDGARLRADLRPDLGDHIRIGTLLGVVRRHTEDGFAVEFRASATRRQMMS